MVKKYTIMALCLVFMAIPSAAWAEDTTILERTQSQKIKKYDNEKSPWLAGALSFALPGTGQMYVEEEFWPQLLISLGFVVLATTYFYVKQERDGSLKFRDDISGQIEPQRLPDAHLEASLLLMQIILPSYWVWNFGDAYRKAEEYNEKVINDLNPKQNSYIMKERLVSITLWRF